MQGQAFGPAYGGRRTARLRAMLIEAGKPQVMGRAVSEVLRFGSAAAEAGTWAGRRLIWIGGKEAFELSFWCGTCPLLFKRLEGSTEALSLPELQQTLNRGVDGIDSAVVDAFAGLLPAGTYIPLLLRVIPELVLPGRIGDYFSGEQIDTWGVDSFWGLPQYPQTPYYRTWQAPVDSSAHVFEFVVPMVPPSWNEQSRVKEHVRLLQNSSLPSAVAVSILDVCQPAVVSGPDYCAHWGLTHFLLDGHHKMQAASEAKLPLQLLSLLSVDEGLAGPVQVDQLVQLRAQPFKKRSIVRD